MVSLVDRFREKRKLKEEEKYLSNLSNKTDLIFEYLGTDLVEPFRKVTYGGSGGDFADPSSWSSEIVNELKKKEIIQGNLKLKYFLEKDSEKGKDEKGLIILDEKGDNSLLIFNMVYSGPWGKKIKKVELNEKGTWEDTFENLYQNALLEKEKRNYQEKLKREEEKIGTIKRDKKSNDFGDVSRAYLESQ